MTDVIQALQNLTALSFNAAFVIAGVTLPLIVGNAICGAFYPKCKFFDSALDVLIGKLFPLLLAVEIGASALTIFAQNLVLQ